MSNQTIQIPIVDLRAQYETIGREIETAVSRVLASQQFILGPAVKEFEAEFSQHFGCAEAIGVASGSDALLLALMALEVGPGDAVITTPFTFFSTVSSITRLGATALFVDIDGTDFLLSVAKLAEFLRQRAALDKHQTIDRATGLRLRAILPVHLFGRCCDMTAIRRLAKEYNLKIVEDVAQACGAQWTVNGKQLYAGTLGDLGCFSFFPSKNLGGAGDGGMITTNDQHLGNRLRMLRMHGESKKYFHAFTGINSRLDSLQAAILSIKLRHLKNWCQKRIERADRYFRLFGECDLGNRGVLGFPELSSDRSHVFNNYVVRAHCRDELRVWLADRGIQSEIYYPLPLHLQDCFTDLGYGKGSFPQAEATANEVLALPLYPELRAEQQQRIVNEIAAFYAA